MFPSMGFLLVIFLKTVWTTSACQNGGWAQGVCDWTRNVQELCYAFVKHEHQWKVYDSPSHWYTIAVQFYELYSGKLAQFFVRNTHTIRTRWQCQNMPVSYYFFSLNNSVSRQCRWWFHVKVDEKELPYNSG